MKENKTITLEPGALDDLRVIELCRFLGEHGLEIGQDLVIRRKSIIAAPARPTPGSARNRRVSSSPSGPS
jgi:hypothetical protein